MNKPLASQASDALASATSPAAAAPLAATAAAPRRRSAEQRIDAASPKSASPTMSSATLIRCRGVFKSYHKGKVTIPVLRGVDADIARGKFTAIVGQSGSGKTTLLHLLATLDKPDKGQIHLNGVRIDNLSPRPRDRMRNQDLGMVFQSYHLLPELTALENVLSPLMICNSLWTWWRRRPEYVARARELLKWVGLEHRETHRPLEMSGGEMQRTAIARAWSCAPKSCSPMNRPAIWIRKPARASLNFALLEPRPGPHYSHGDAR